MTTPQQVLVDVADLEALRDQQATKEIGTGWHADYLDRLVAAIPEPEPLPPTDLARAIIDGGYQGDFVANARRLARLVLAEAEGEPGPLPPSFVPAGTGWCPVHRTAACPEQYMLMLNGDVAPGYKGRWSESMRCGKREQTYRLSATCYHGSDCSGTGPDCGPEPLPPSFVPLLDGDGMPVVRVPKAGEWFLGDRSRGLFRSSGHNATSRTIYTKVETER